VPGAAPERTEVTAQAVNSGGQVVGWARLLPPETDELPPPEPPFPTFGSHAYVWSEGTGFTLLPAFAGDVPSEAVASDLNDRGDVVGSAIQPGGEAITAVAWPRGGAIVPLNGQDLNPSVALAVNGNPLNLYTDDQGRFARPYAFGAGSNSVEVRSSEGKSLKRVQFYEANNLRTPARIRVVLGWDDPKAELDLHIITPDGQHAFWARPAMSNGGGLDPDGVDGPGPEMFTMTAPMHGTYLVYVNYWGNFGSGGYNFDETGNQNEVITSQINLVLNENTVDEKRETFIVPLRAIGDLLLVKTFNY